MKFNSYRRNPKFIGAVAVLLLCTALGIRPALATASEPAEPGVGAHLVAEDSYLPESYVYLVARGKQYLRDRQFRLAADAFEAALREELVEAPNYEMVVYLAEAKCLSGDRESGLRLLKDFDCMLKVEVGLRRCFLEEGENAIPNPELTRFCFERMCSEIYLPYYEKPTEQMRIQVSRMREEATRVRNACLGRGRLAGKAPPQRAVGVSGGTPCPASSPIPGGSEQGWLSPTGQPVRGCDAYGCGHYGASRGTRVLRGVEYLATPGQAVRAPTAAKVVRTIDAVHPDVPQMSGVVLETPSGYQIKIFYVDPYRSLVGTLVPCGMTIGTAQDLTLRYPPKPGRDLITNHVYLEIHSPQGRAVDPRTFIP